MRATVLTALCLGIAASAHAQSRERIRISLNVADQVTSHTLAQNFSVPINVEPAPITTSIDLGSAPMFDVGASYRVLSRLAVGFAVSTLSHNVDAAVDAKVPHPFFFNTLRPVSGNVAGLQHEETGVHVYAMYVLPLAGKLGVGVFGGPSHFSVKQGFVTDIDYTASYPYDTATFTGAPTKSVSAGVIGYNVGADVSWQLSRNFAVGGLIRFAGASSTVTVADGNDVDTKIGGLQTGAGIRIMF